MSFSYLLQSPSGFSANDYCFLGQRFAEGGPFKLGYADTWLLQQDPTGAAVREGVFGWLTMLWRSTTGVVYLSEAERGLHIVRDPLLPRRSWQTVTVPGVAMGVWGLSDACVFVWSLTADGGRLFRWDGRKLEELPSPGKIVRVHGLAADALYAVGQEGLVARWDGQRWFHFRLPTRETFSGIFAAGPDEFYASGQSWTLVEGSASGCRIRAIGPGPLHDVAVWKGEVWVAALEFGLLKLDPQAPLLKVVDAEIPAISFDARGDLLIGCSDSICTTDDGTTFTQAHHDLLAAGTASRPPLWVRPLAVP